MALALATGGLAAGVAAAALRNLAPPPSTPEILLARAPRRSFDALIRTTSDLAAADRTAVDGIPTTSVARTLIDLGGRVPRPAFEDMLDTAIVGRLVTVDRLRARAEELRSPRRSGCAVVLGLLETRQQTDARAANRWEARVLHVVRALQLPEPELNHRVRVNGRVRYLDLAWPNVKVAVEFDGFVPHSTRRVFDDDRVRQNDLVADGWTVFRVTAAMLRDVDTTFTPIAAAVLGKVARFNTPAFETA